MRPTQFIDVVAAAQFSNNNPLQIVASASTRQKDLRETIENKADVNAAAKIGERLAAPQRLACHAFFRSLHFFFAELPQFLRGCQHRRIISRASKGPGHTW